MGVAPIANNKPQAAINREEEFENEWRACVEDSHKRLSLSANAFYVVKCCKTKAA
jgi:hypothetical protein